VLFEQTKSESDARGLVHLLSSCRADPALHIESCSVLFWDRQLDARQPPPAFTFYVSNGMF